MVRLNGFNPDKKVGDSCFSHLTNKKTPLFVMYFTSGAPRGARISSKLSLWASICFSQIFALCSVSPLPKKFPLVLFGGPISQLEILTFFNKKICHYTSISFTQISGAPRGARIPNLWFRRPTLYPIALWAHTKLC